MMEGNDVNRGLLSDVVLARDGNAAAQDRIIDAISDTVYYTCFQTLRDEVRAAEATREITQMILCRIGELEDPAAYESWVNSITAAHCKTFLDPEIVGSFAKQDKAGRVYRLTDEKTVPKLTVEEDEAIRVMRDAIERLPDEQRLCIVLHYFNEMKPREIADALGVPERAVRSRLNRANRVMKGSLAPYEQKRAARYALLAAPLFGKLFGLWKITAAAGSAAASMCASLLRGAGGKVVAGTVAAILIGTAGLALQNKTVRPTEPTVGSEQARVCEAQIDTDMRIPRDQGSEIMIETDEVIVETRNVSEAQPRKTSPEQPVSETSEAFANEPVQAFDDEAPHASAAAPEHTPAEKPEEQEPQTAGPRDYEPGPEAEAPTEEPEEEPIPPLSSETEQLAWSEWSTEKPPEGAQVRTKLQYRYRIVSDAENGLGPERGAGYGAEPENAPVWSEWSDEAPELFLSDGVRIILEMRTLYSYCD